MSLLAPLGQVLTIGINIDPTITELAGFELAWHGLTTAFAIFAGLWLAIRLAAQRHLDLDETYTIGLFVIVGGIIGARTLFVLENWSRFEGNFGEVFAINEGGISIYGALVGGMVLGFAYMALHRSGMPVLRTTDVAAAGAILGMAIGRIGDLINGEHLARPSDLPWAVRYLHPESPSFGLPAQHPAVAYEMFGDLLILGLLLVLLRLRGAGWAFFTWLLAYGILRFAVSFLRDDDLVVIGLRMAQIIALGGIAAGVAGLAWLAYRQRWAVGVESSGRDG